MLHRYGISLLGGWCGKRFSMFETTKPQTASSEYMVGQTEQKWTGVYYV